MQGPNGMQPPVNTIKLENPGYYCNSYTPPAPEHTSMMASGAYSEYLYWNVKTVTFPILAWTFEAVSQKGISNLYRIWGSHSGATKSSVFWDLTLCSPLKVNRCFRGRWRRRVPLKRQLTFSGLHSVISQNTELFMRNLITGLSYTVH
jgi:hypothetical protein